MKKILILLSTIFLLNGCAESLALLGSGASNGRIVQSSLNSAISYGIKRQTGKLLWSMLLLMLKKKILREKKKPAFPLLKLQSLNFAQLLKKKLS